VVDGTGAPWFYGDVGVRDGRIVAIGKFAEHAAKKVIEAKGSVVTPGFIYMHSHSDLTLIKDGRGLSKIRALETPGEEQFPPEGEESLSMPTTDDLIALAKVSARYGGIYSNHMRDQGAHLVDSVCQTALPHAFPDEISHVIINGVTVIRNGEHTGARPGRPLYGRGRREST
jgi:N-acyl-D-aspartate/D-glutamate deacylase